MYALTYTLDFPVKIKRTVVGSIQLQRFVVTGISVAVQGNSRRFNMPDPEGFTMAFSAPDLLYDDAYSRYGVVGEEHVVSAKMNRLVVPARMIYEHFKTEFALGIESFIPTIIGKIGVVHENKTFTLIARDGSQIAFRLSEYDPVVKKRGLLLYELYNIITKREHGTFY